MIHLFIRRWNAEIIFILNAAAIKSGCPCSPFHAIAETPAIGVPAMKGAPVIALSASCSAALSHFFVNGIKRYGLEMEVRGNGFRFNRLISVHITVDDRSEGKKGAYRISGGEYTNRLGL